MVGKVMKGNNELWLEICPFNAGNDYYLTLVVKEAMKQAVTANDMFEALDKDGRFALNINFDTGKAIIKPEYKPLIIQVAEMLKANPQLKISVEGHTDGRGDRKANIALSEERAKAVMQELIALGIDSKRLTAVGYGPDKPIGDNNTEEGRAKNRRVELVKQK
jgi:outer membrane protein OmpA-like peptidoglycan-associated protein